MLNNETKQRFDAWWKFENSERPLFRLVRKKKNFDNIPTVDNSYLVNKNMDYHLNPEYRIGELRNKIMRYDFLAEAFPAIDLNIGPGSIAAYYGAEPYFSDTTVWYEASEHELKDIKSNCSYENAGSWWDFHKSTLEKAVELSNEEFITAIPDLLENLDILSAMRGTEQACFDLYDEPEIIKEIMDNFSRDYYKFYDDVYNIVKAADGSSAYTSFYIWSRGKVIKTQCDFGTVISDEMFKEFTLPYIKKQCDLFDNSLYHLDGADNIRHLDPILSIDSLNAVQWEPGAGANDAGNEEWYCIYDKIINAGKSLWLGIYDGSTERKIDSIKKIIKRYGNNILFVLPDMEYVDSEKIIKEFF